MNSFRKRQNRRKNGKRKSLARKNRDRLTDMVRTEYLKHLKGCLMENIKIYYENNSQNDIIQMNEHINNAEKYTKQLENKAIEACMLAPVYQQCMRRIIKQVLKKSAKYRLARLLRKSCSNKITVPTKQTKDQAVQTCTDLNMHLQQPVTTLANDSSNKKHTYRSFNTKPISIASEVSADVSIVDIPLPPKNENVNFNNEVTMPFVCNSIENCHNHLVENVEDDEVAKGLEEMFCEDKSKWDDFLGFQKDMHDDPQIQNILMEIDQATSIEKVHSKNQHVQFSSSNNNNNNQTMKKIPLSQSLWPCELYMQRKRLNENLDRLGDKDMRYYDNIKSHFRVLFGEDSDDEFTACSPSIELDNILLGSCQERIKPWIIKHLMPAMNDGLIGNRYLFKELAKKLSRSIIQDNQYPDEHFIKNSVALFFCLHPNVMSISDLMDIPQLCFNSKANQRL